MQYHNICHMLSQICKLNWGYNATSSQRVNNNNNNILLFKFSFSCGKGKNCFWYCAYQWWGLWSTCSNIILYVNTEPFIATAQMNSVAASLSPVCWAEGPVQLPGRTDSFYDDLESNCFSLFGRWIPFNTVACPHNPGSSHAPEILINILMGALKLLLQDPSASVFKWVGYIRVLV